MASTIDYSALVQYTDQLKVPLLREAVLGGRTIQKATVYTGIKHSQNVNLFNSVLTPQAGGCGAINPQGSVSLGIVPLTVTPIKIEESICYNDMELYWTGQLMKSGSYNETGFSAFNEAYNADKVAKMQKSNSIGAWQASTTGTFSASYNLYNGYLHILKLTSASASVTYAGLSYSGAATSTNVIAIVDDMIDKMTANIPDIINENDLEVNMSIPAYRTYVRAWRDRGNGNGNYWVDPKEAEDLTFTVPGTNVKVSGDIGLNGRNEMVLTSNKNLLVGTDLEGEEDRYMTWFETKDDMSYFRAKYKLGFAIARPAYVVMYKG